MSDYQPYRTRKIGCLKILAIGVVLIAILSVVHLPADTDAARNSTSDAQSTWSYSQNKDDLRNDMQTFAQVSSDDLTFFDMHRHPGARFGSGSTKLELHISRDRSGDHLFFTIDHGAFECGTSGCTGTIKIDEKIWNVDLEEPSDGSVDYLLVRSPTKWIRRIQNSRKIMVELPFYQQGLHQFTFSEPVPLNWPPKPSDYR